MRRLLPFAGLALLSACTTPKLAASEALAPDLVVHSVPEGAEVSRNGRPVGHCPVTIPVHKGEGKIELALSRQNYFPSAATLDGDALFAASGGSAWIPLRSDNMGTETEELDPRNAEEIVRGGLYAAKAGRCEEALQFYSRALAVNPAVVRAYRDRAKCLFKLSRTDEAIQSLEQYVLAAPDAPDVAKVQEQISRARGRRDIDLADPTAQRKGQ